MKQKQNRTKRSSRSVQSETDLLFSALLDRPSVLESRVQLAEIRRLHGKNGNGESNSPDNVLAEQYLEQMVLKYLRLVYQDVIPALVNLGHDRNASIKTAVMHTNCYGDTNVGMDIFKKSVCFLNNNKGITSRDEIFKDVPDFTTLEKLLEHGLKGMVCVLQDIRPNLSRGEALWCLLMCELNVGKARTKEIPKSVVIIGDSKTVSNNLESVGNSGGDGIFPHFPGRFHSGGGFGSEGGSAFALDRLSPDSEEMSLQKDIECPKGFDMSPSLKSYLNRNVAEFRARFREDSQFMEAEMEPFISSGHIPPSVGAGEGSQSLNNEDEANLVLRKFCTLSIDENYENVDEDRKNEMKAVLLNQVNDLKKQVKERKGWAYHKTMQAAIKISSDLNELKKLRKEKVETLCLSSAKGELTLNDSKVKKLSEMKNSLRKANDNADQKNAMVRMLEIENAEIVAETEASKLSASESVSNSLEVAKREKKILKKLSAWEKQITKLQEEIAYGKQNLKELQHCLERVEQDDQETEAKWRRDLQDKELFSAQLVEEQRAKEAAEASNTRKLEALRLKIETDLQRHKYNLERVEQYLSHLKSSAPSNEPNNQANPERDQLEANSGRECIICQENDASVIFLPCAHQVLCSNCNNNFRKNRKATCLFCRTRTPIERRIRVFGASS